VTDLPRRVSIDEEGPREGFRIEPGPIATADSIARIDALSAAGLRHIQAASSVSPGLVPGWADAEAAVAGAHAGPRPGVASFGATVGGLGGCPSAAHEGGPHSLPPGNIASEETGIDLDAPIEAGHLAERIVGHPLPSALLRGGSLRGFRARAAAGIAA